MIGKKKGSRAGAHRRNAEATRKRILASARRAFARAGYDGVGLREIAQGAGVTAMMVNRYFGSKERLFAEVVAGAIAAPSILTRENLASPTLGRDLAAALVERTAAGANPLDGFLIMLNSLSNKRAAKIERALIEAHQAKAIAAALTRRAGARARRSRAVVDRRLPGDAPDDRPPGAGRGRSQNAGENSAAATSAARRGQPDTPN